MMRVGWSTYSLNVLGEVLEGGMGSKGFKQLFFVDQGVNKVGVALDLVDKTAVHDFQNHAKHLFQYGYVGHGLVGKWIFFCWIRGYEQLLSV